MKLFNVTMVGMALSIAGVAGAEVRMTVVPSSPVQNEPVYVRITSDAGDAIDTGSFIYERSGAVTVPANQLRIVPNGAAGQPGLPVDYTYYLGRFPQGSYSLVLGSPNNPPIATATYEVRSSSLLRTIDGREEARNPLDHSGLWYNPAQRGSSVVLFHSPQTRDVAGGIYGYDASKNPVWYTIVPGQWRNAALTEYVADVYRSTGSPIGTPGVPADFTSAKVGTVTLRFVDVNELRAELTIGSQTTQASYSRFEF